MLKMRPAVLLAVGVAAILAALAPTAAAVPPDPPNGHYFGTYLLCDDGFKAVGGRCLPLPKVTHGHYFGSYLLCDNGYQDFNGRCVALPPVTHGHYFGSYLLCDD